MDFSASVDLPGEVASRSVVKNTAKNRNKNKNKNKNKNNVSTSKYIICFSHTLQYDACLLYSKQHLAYISKVRAIMMPSYYIIHIILISVLIYFIKKKCVGPSISTDISIICII